ncbi:MAG: response regulator [Lachnospiraceae bacterium]|nr:response regulator [Candidatus Colinaster scatohippi]
MKQNKYQSEEEVTNTTGDGDFDAGRLERMRAYLHEDYLAIYEIDVKTGLYVTILNSTDSESVAVPYSGNYKYEIIEGLFSEYVSRGHLGELINISDSDNLVRVLSVEKRTEYEFETATGSGEWRKVVFSGAYYDESGKPEKILVAFSKINESTGERLRKQQEIVEAFRKEQELSEVRMEFISRMSHDIRTPLNAIVGMTMIAHNDISNREAIEDCLTKIEVASDQLLALVNDLIDIDKAEIDKQKVANEPFDLAEVVESVCMVAEPMAKAKRHILDVSTENIKHEMVSGDVQRILRIVNNLVSNAIRYTPDGGRISVVFKEEGECDDGRFNYKVVITDNGYGMSEDFLSKIYDPFIRGTDRRVQDESGTGLGMAITRNLVELIGGTIDIQSEQDVGTQVTVEFPLTIYRMGTVIVPAPVVSNGILVLCNQDMCEHRRCTASGRCFKEVFEEQGIPVDTATSIDSARFMIDAKKTKNSNYYAIIINAKQYTETMGDMAIKLRMYAGAFVPIVLITDRDALAIELDARSKGVNFFLKRPVFVKNIVGIFQKIEEQQIDEKEVEQKRLPNCVGRRILVAEDNDVNAQILVAILSTSGAVIDRVSNGEEAYKMVKDNPSDWYDLILMDIEMPIMNGYEATRAIRLLENDTNYRRTIVAMTANAFSSDAVKAREAGMSDHLTKPIQIDKLSEVLRRYM